MYFLTTAHLGFRHWTEDDLLLAQSLWGDPSVTALIGGTFTPEKIHKRLQFEIAAQRDSGVQYWPIFWLQNHDFVGCCGLRPYRKIYELGFHLRPPYWRRGLALEAGSAAIHYAFMVLGMNQLFAGHHPDNHASQHVLQKLGFVYSGDELYPPTGALHPGYLLSRP